ncbi:MAG: FAD-dependent oxidoreductase, partial [Flavisolibacter sp.]
MILPSRFQTLLCLLLASSLCRAQQVLHTEVLVVGGGTGGTAAGIQSARMGVHTVIVEQGPWLGGMLSSAGVSATDGNHLLPSGIWEEFRQQLYKVYGGPAALASGWVSFSQFEPHVADSIFKTMAARTPALTVKYGWQFIKTLRQGDRITGALFKNTSGQTLQIRAPVTIDATELGDVMASANVPYDLGMEASSMTGEPVIIPQTNHVVQDLTYVAVLKDYGPRADCTIAKPAGYRPQEFDGACLDYYTGKALPAPKVDSKKMLEYGRLPHNKYMLNWPLKGNDVYLNVVEMSQTEREQKLKQAKETTRRFIYFIQHDLGYKNLGLTDDEFPTA